MIKTMKILILLGWIFAFYGFVMSQEKLEKDASCYVIRKIIPEARVHDFKLEKFVLYDICSAEKNDEKETVFVIEKGVTKSVKAKPIKTFENGIAAQKFAEEHKIIDNEFAKIADCQIIRIVNMPMSLLGKKVENAKPEIVLLNTCLMREKEWEVLPKVKLMRNGKEIEREFWDIRTFKSQAEAEEYARQNGLTDVDFNQNISNMTDRNIDDEILNYKPIPIPKCRLIRVIEMPLRKDAKTKTTPTLALLDVCLPAKAREMQHPMITFEENGRQVSQIFEVVQTFANKADAETYARENFVTDIQISQKYKDYIADCQIIRVIEIPLTKKPNVPSEPKFALLNTCLNDEIPQQRPVEEVVRNGKKEFREVEIIKIFADKKEAEIYAKENGLIDVKFESN